MTTSQVRPSGVPKDGVPIDGAQTIGRGTAFAASGQGAHAVVIGAGFGGMAAALRLRARGYRVTLVDRCPMLGGRAQVFERDGFVFDGGPTVITAPFLLEELFSLFSENMADHVDLRPVEPWYRFRFDDGKTFDYGGTIEQTLAEIARFEPRDQAGYLKLLETSKRIFDVGFTGLADRPFDRFSTMLKLLPQLLRLRSDRSVYGLVKRHLKNPQLRQAFSIQPLLVGGNPFDTTSIYSLIHFLERQWGVHFPMGGTGALVKALGSLMERQGIEVRLGETVEQITTDGGRATGVLLAGGRELPADIVVSNADAPHLYRSMVPGKKRRWTKRKLDRLRYSMGLFVLHFGTRRQYSDIAHHTISMGPRYRGLLHDIFEKKVLSDDFSLYLHRPTATDPGMAPPGCDTFYVLSPVPNLKSGIDWSEQAESYGDRILEALERTMMPGLRESLAVRFHMTPQDFGDRYLSVNGAGFSIQPLLQQSAWFRFHNRSEELENLFLVGAGTHPGAGVPGVLSSAKVLDRVVPSPDVFQAGNAGRVVR
ncbi:MAG: phytoene desaturase [Planctomycetota bacterium]|jgi:phytoene desaturase